MMKYLEMICSEHDGSALSAQVGSPGAQKVWGGGGVTGRGEGPGPDGGDVTRGPGARGHHRPGHGARAAGGPRGPRVGDDGSQAAHPELAQARARQHGLAEARQSGAQTCPG